MGVCEGRKLEVSAPVGGCHGHRVEKPKVDENPRVSVIEDSSFCPTPRIGSPGVGLLLLLLSYHRRLRMTLRYARAALDRQVS